jgi:hypothetical protein
MPSGTQKRQHGARRRAVDGVKREGQWHREA